MGAAAPKRNREATQNAILEAASELIAEKGVDGFAMSEVAERGKINRALIYHYYHNRENLVFETIRYIVQRYEAINGEASVEPVEGTVRLLIKHPEIARFIFHLLLNGQHLPRLSSNLLERIRAVQAAKESAGLDLDPEIVVISGWLTQLAWTFARDEVAHQLGISVEEADERFIRQLRKTVIQLNPTLSLPD